MSQGTLGRGTGAFWLPVVWMQARMRDLAANAVAEGKPLSAQYHRSILC
jgi:uncharacterized membrane protein